MTGLRVLGVVPFAWPAQRGGSEVAVHRLLAWLAKAGHEVRCLVQRGEASPLDGVDYASVQSVDVSEWWEWANVAVSHRGSTVAVASFRELHGDLPALQWAHNWSWFPTNRCSMDTRLDVVAWNSTAMELEQGKDWNGDSMILRPPTFSEDFAPCYGDSITQVNLSRTKGGSTFWQLARKFSDLPFLGVVGGWGAQVNASGKDLPVGRCVDGLRRNKPANVTIAEGTDDMLSDVYARTRVLLMPTGFVSEHQTGEAWGLVAAEAICCGIPVIATDSPGTRELFGDSGILLADDDVDAWERELERLQDPDEWAYESERAFERAAQLDPTFDLEEVEKLLEGLASR